MLDRNGSQVLTKPKATSRRSKMLLASEVRKNDGVGSCRNTARTAGLTSVSSLSI